MSAAPRRGPRVLMTADAVGGVWTYCVELVRELSRRGAEVLVATMGEPPDARRRATLEAVPGVTVAVSDYQLEWLDDPWDDVRAAGGWLLDLEVGFRPNVIHLNGFCHAALPFRAPVLVVAHSCVLSWWRAVRGDEAPPRYGRYREAVQEGLRTADVVVAPTRAMLEELERIYGELGRRQAIPNGRSAQDLSGGRGSRAADERERTVFACGRAWDEAKNLELLDRAAPRVTWPIEIAGSMRGPQGRERRFAHATPLGLLSPGEVRRRMASASIFAHPARYEPFGLGPLEAALAGCPLILGDLASLREVWGDAATYVPPDDPDPLAEAMLRLVKSPTSRRESGLRARARAAELTPEAMGERYARLYRELSE